ncbi:hypothetical protein SAMN06265795_1326 [Noviherbaspirillum humi]|uniref:Colicin import membrane protein n=1 Tax=Noviherbaspirillum humi TaxID=1688639 RepID=A0A239M6Q3_9BURK|nr:hypothetical protein [Noviherbaspirillum humi]SNT37744.1 hypothetical protein SAMN06265795_1326 [Noviherbaspirillum humi]
MMIDARIFIGAVLASLIGAQAQAKLPPPTPEQQQSAAQKKAQADAEQEKAKQELDASMNAVAKRWRETASTNGWQTYPASSGAGAQAASGNQGGQGAAAPNPPIRSEKQGTAPPSTDVKPDAKPAAAK